MSELMKPEPKSFWARPEGKTGMLAIAGGLAGLWWLGPTLIGIFAMGITLLGQAITLTILGAILFSLWMIITNKKFQTLVSYFFKSAMRKLTGWFVEIDPIGIMKSYIEDLNKKREIMAEARDKLNGQIKDLERKIGENNKGYTAAMSLAKVAKERENQAQFQVQARQGLRLEKLNEESFKPLLGKMQLHKRALDKYYEVTGIVIEDLTNEVSAREMQRRMILASHTAMKAAAAIINGGTDEKELFDQATEFVALDYAMKLGEIENFMENSKGFVDGIDIQNGVFEAEALKRLEAWENDGTSVLFGTGKAQMLEQSSDTQVIFGNIGQPAATSDYANLIGSTRR